MIVIGHRGARGLAPENTLASIQKALECGVDEVEIDIRITNDGVAVLNHNRALLADAKPYVISQYTFAELKKLKPDLTTLAEALKSVRGTAALYIEVKHGEPVAPVVATIRESGVENGGLPAILLGSKSQKVLWELHTLLPEVPTIVIEPWSAVRAQLRARQVGTKRLSMRSWWLWRGLLRALHRGGYLVTPYTMNNPAKVAKWQPYIYGVVTDFPDRFAR